MEFFKNLYTKLFKNRKKKNAWLPFYSREENSIKFTNKSIYNYLIDEVGEDKDYIAAFAGAHYELRSNGTA